MNWRGKAYWTLTPPLLLGFSALVLGGGLLMLIFGALPLYTLNTQGVAVQGQVVAVDASATRWGESCDVAYSYDVGGQTYRGADVIEAACVLAPGDPLTVLYDAGDPSTSMHQEENVLGYFLMGGLFITLGLVGIVKYISVRRKGARV